MLLWYDINSVHDVQFTSRSQKSQVTETAGKFGNSLASERELYYKLFFSFLFFFAVTIMSFGSANARVALSVL